MTLNAILSIKPKFVKEIISDTKKYEYRKNIFKKDIDKIYIYSSTPEKRIIGYFYFTEYLQDTPKNIWEKTNGVSGILKDEYDEYFKNKSEAYAIKIDKLYLFNEPVNPRDFFVNFVAPQSYKYIKDELLKIH